MYEYIPMNRPACSANLPEAAVWDFVELPWEGTCRTDLPRSQHRYGVIRMNVVLDDEAQARWGLKLRVWHIAVDVPEGPRYLWDIHCGQSAGQSGGGLSSRWSADPTEARIYIDKETAEGDVDRLKAEYSGWSVIEGEPAVIAEESKKAGSSRSCPIDVDRYEIFLDQNNSQIVVYDIEESEVAVTLPDSLTMEEAEAITRDIARHRRKHYDRGKDAGWAQHQAAMRNLAVNSRPRG